MPELRVELSDDLLDAIERTATRAGVSPSALVAEAVRSHLDRPDLDSRRRALAALERVLTPGSFDPVGAVREARRR